MSKLGTALVAAGFFTTGIIVGNVSWEGSDSIGNIEDNIGQMENEISEALADNEYLTEQFNALMATHNASIDEANAEIHRIDAERNKLTAQIEELQQTANFDASEDEQEIQAEITRLESELEKANSEVAELETFVQDAADRSSYEAIDRSQFDAAAAGGNIQQGASVVYTGALVEAVGQAEATRYASEAFTQRVKSALDIMIFRNDHIGEVTKVDYQDGNVVFYVSNSINSFLKDVTKEVELKEIQKEIGRINVIDADGKKHRPL